MKKSGSKKMLLVRIISILEEYSDIDHRLSQTQIGTILRDKYGLEIERKTIGSSIALLKDEGYDIVSSRAGCYLSKRKFEESELKLLIDGVLCSQHVSAVASKNLIERLCSLSSKYFRSSVKNITSVSEWNKTDNDAIFRNIDKFDEAIENHKQVSYDYNKYNLNKKLAKTSEQVASPYQMILHNQKYYLMAYNEKHGNMSFHRIDRITNVTILDERATPLKNVEGYDQGIDYKKLSCSRPYMYSDKPELVIFTAKKGIVDQVIDWFGKDINITDIGDDQVTIKLLASPLAMEHWALQYLGNVQIISPTYLKNKIIDKLENGLLEYKGKNNE